MTVEGATPIERLDFALQTQHAEEGLRSAEAAARNEKGREALVQPQRFFEHKITQPSIYDEGKEKDPKDRLRMPQPYLTPEWRTALTTFLLGSVGTEGANVPRIALLQSAGSTTTGYSERLVGDQEVQLHGLSPASGRTAFGRMDLPFYQTPEGKDLLAAAIDERRRACRSGVAVEVPARSVVEW